MSPRVVFATAIGAALAVAACTESGVLDDVGTFPCARNGTCPILYSCDADAGVCKKGGGGNLPGVADTSVDGVCESGLQCKDDNNVCTLAVCTPVANINCSGQHTVGYGGSCLRDCSTTLCPSPLVCTDVPFGTDVPARACVGPKAANEDTRCADACDPSNNACIAGTCVLPCDPPSAGCPNGRTCMVPGADGGTGKLGCFIDCSAGKPACPHGTTCKPAQALDAGTSAMGCVASG